MYHSRKWDADYVQFKGVYLAPRTVMKMLKIPEAAQVSFSQGGLSFGKFSSMTHAGIGTGDLRIKGMTHDQVWRMGTHLLEINIIPCVRGYRFDSFQGPSLADKTDGNEHIHFLDIDCLDTMHPEAQAQVHELLHGGDGLVGSGPYVGPSIDDHLREWARSPWNKGKPLVVRKPHTGLDGVRKTANPPKRWRRGDGVATQRIAVHRWPDSQSQIKRYIEKGQKVPVGAWIGQADTHGWVQSSIHSTEFFNYDQVGQ